MIALFGPTGVGKTAVAIELAERLRRVGGHPVAVSADALQVYQGLETLTGAATARDRAVLPHRLLSFLPIDATFSAGQYAELAHAEIDALIGQGQMPLVVGGTGLYLRAALTNLQMKPPPPASVREHWLAELERRGPAELHAILAGRAPGVAATIAASDRQRIVRALELFEAGEADTPSGSDDDAESELWSDAVRHPTLLAGLVMDRAQLYERIDARVDEMIAAGAQEEVRRASAAGTSATARKALGFDELLAGDIDGMKRRTRNYARRQLTWLRKLAGVEVIDTTERRADEVAEEVLRLWLAGRGAGDASP